ICLIIHQWGVEYILEFGANHQYSVYQLLVMSLTELILRDESMIIKVTPEYPKAMGMGDSAALAVAIIRALNKHYELSLTDENVRELSYKSETIIHGQASGIDNTVATYGKLISYRKDDPPKIEMLNLNQDIPIVIGLSGIE